jgi:FixJ family two-component response regulator
MDRRQTIFVVDDDLGMRRSIAFAVRSAKLHAETYATAEEFLAAWTPDTPGCLVLDLRMPGMTGLSLQQTLAQRGITIPIVFITGHGDIPACVQAMKAGAVDFLEKPFDRERLLHCIQHALSIDCQTREQRDRRTTVLQRYRLLSQRERDVMQLLVAGKTTKQIAAQLRISSKTVDNHRASVLEKMTVDNLVELTRLAVTYGLPVPPEGYEFVSLSPDSDGSVSGSS